MKKKRPAVPARLRALLQQEIRSTCPFCGSQDAVCFEVHHLDGNPANNEVTNLLMLCANCHEKIHVGQLTTPVVTKRKQELAAGNSGLTVAAIVLDEPAGNWQAHPAQAHTYFQLDPMILAHPVLRLTLLNLSPHTVVLHTITGRVRHLYSGLAGLGPEPQVLQPLAAYHLALPAGGEMQQLRLREPLQRPAQQACVIKLTLTSDTVATQALPLDGRNVVYLMFQFNDAQTAAAPALFFNCLRENEPLSLWLLD